MIVYNVTLSVNPEIEKEFLKWLGEIHLPEVLETGLFIEGRIFKVLETPGGKEVNSYAVQYRLENWKYFNQYQTEYAAMLQQKTKTKYGDNVLAFRTFLEEI